jgi:hypothetical protein
VKTVFCGFLASGAFQFFIKAKSDRDGLTNWIRHQEIIYHILMITPNLNITGKLPKKSPRQKQLEADRVAAF